MKTIPLLSKFMVLLAFMFVLQSCSNSDDDGGPQDDDEISATDDDPDSSDDDPNTPNSIPNIVELAQTVDALSTLVDALGVADDDIIEALSADGPLTVFAPTNQAFEDLLNLLDGFSSLDDFDDDEEKELLGEILRYHVISGAEAFSEDLSDGQALTTLQSEELNVNLTGGIFIQDKTDDPAEVTGEDNAASNGVVHIVDKVLLPQAILDALFPKPSIMEIVTEEDDLSLLEEAILTAELQGDLSVEGPFTLFAPTNEAIEELFELLGDNFNSFEDFDNFLELQILEQILLYHVVPGNLTSSDLTPGTLNTLLTDESIEIITSGDTFVIGDASAVDAELLDVDKLGSNGVVHVIDKILIPQEVQDFLDTVAGDPGSGIPTIKELVESSPDLDFLAQALEITGLLETLGEDGPFTVFAPTNETINLLFALLGSSFDSVEDFNLDFEIDLLRQVLSYHVIPGLVTSNDLSVGSVTTLLPNDGFEVQSENGTFFLHDGLGMPVNLLVTDIPAGNGVIHTIDRVMVPESVIDLILSETESTLLALIEDLDECDLFVQAFMLAHAHLDELELGHQEFTFFLPTNAAFLDLFDALDGVDSLADFDTIEELELLATILSYHLVVGTTATSTNLFNNQELTTVQGETLNISIGQNVYILDKTGTPAQVTSPDIDVFDGVIHIIDKVLIPNEVIASLSS